MTTKIIDAVARLDDVNALNALLAPMRDGATLKKKLRPGYRGHKYFYDRHSHTARYLLTNGDVVSCFSVAYEIFQGLEKITKEILIDEMRVACQAFQDSPHKTWGAHLQDAKIGYKD